MADRRHVPDVVVALHLRPGLPGRAHRARARARRRAVAPTARTSRRRRSRRRSRSSPSGSATTSGSSRPIGLKKGVWAKRGQGRVAHPAARGRVRLPQPPRLRSRSRLRAAPARDEHGQALQRDQAHRVLAAAAARRSTATRRTTARSRRCSPSSAATAGARAARSSPGGARRRHEAFTGAEPVYQLDGDRAAARWSATRCTTRS